MDPKVLAKLLGSTQSAVLQGQAELRHMRGIADDLKTYNSRAREYLLVTREQMRYWDEIARAWLGKL